MIKQSLTTYKSAFRDGNTAVIGNRTYHTDLVSAEDVQKAILPTKKLVGGKQVFVSPKIKVGDVVTYTKPEVKNASGNVIKPAGLVTAVYVGNGNFY